MKYVFSPSLTLTLFYYFHHTHTHTLYTDTDTGAKKSGKKNGVTYELLDSNRVTHIPSVQNYPVEEVMLDLLHTAALLLSVTGRLVYLIPTTYDFELTDLPVHPCFVINTTCEQCQSVVQYITVVS